MKRLMVLGVFALALAVAPAAPADASSHLPPAGPATTLPRTGGPGSGVAAGVLGALGVSAIAGGLLLRRRRDDV
jgi:LPXTG-motif cell wall-anchored protein